MLPNQAVLPEPSADAQVHSARLRAQLAVAIARSEGCLPFDQYMEQVLYAPGLGYYAAGAARFNGAGDFTTAPEISPLFGRTLARALAPGLRALRTGDVGTPGGPASDAVTVLEPGAGTGRLALVLLAALDALGAAPDRYWILEPSPALQAEQRRTLQALPAHLRGRVEWLQALPAPFVGAIVANEVLDALPVELLQTDEAGSVLACAVTVDAQGQLGWTLQAASAAQQAAAAARWAPHGLPPAGTRFELAPATSAWVATLADCLRQGVMLLIDYGYPARELYLPQRTRGTLMCHYRHHAHDDPFWWPGLQDLTAHVDFTAIGARLDSAGLVLQQFCTQAAFLLGHGLLETLDAGLQPGSVDWLRQTTALQKLVSPAEMGESFKVLVAVRPGERGLPAAALFDGPGPLACSHQLGLEQA